MKAKLVGLLCGVGLAAVSLTAKADLIHDTTYFLEDNLGNPDAELAFVRDELKNQDLFYLDKWDMPGKKDEGGWDGGGAISGDDYFGINIEMGASSGEVNWDLTGSGFELRAVLLKDGFVQPYGFLYTLFTVTPDQYLVSGWEEIFFGDPERINREISHVTFFGTKASVPAPAPLLLLGGGLLGMVLLRRRRN